MLQEERGRISAFKCVNLELMHRVQKENPPKKTS